MGTETCPRCENRGPAYTIACTVNEAGGGQCRESLSDCDFCDGRGIVEVVAANRYRRGREIMEKRKKYGLTVRQQAQILGMSEVLLNDIEWGRADWPKWVNRKLLAEYGYEV